MKIPEKCPKCGGKLAKGETHRDRDFSATKYTCKGCGKKYAAIDMKILYSSESERKQVEEDLAWKQFLDNTPPSEIRKPIASLVLPDAAEVDATDMGKYSDIFFALESMIFTGWRQQPSLDDKEVLEALDTALSDLDSQPEGSFAWILATSLKARLMFRKGRGGKDFTMGEIVSCIRLLARIAREHENSTGDGYLRYLRAFFTTGLPETAKEHVDYLVKNEL